MIQTCLIAAHDPWFIQLLRIFAEESGFQVVQAYEGQEILPILQQEKPEVVLLQMDLPGTVKSSEVMIKIRTDPAIRSTPILVFSWQGDNFGEIEGASARLIEPVTYESFLEALQMVGVHCMGQVKPNGSTASLGQEGGTTPANRKPGRKRKVH
jgi:CheY-like chemotaxis protein